MASSATVGDLVSQPYKYGFVTDIETEKIAKGLSEDVVRLISAKKNEPAFLLDFRLRAYRQCDPGPSADRLPGDHLLRGAEAAGEEGQPR
jgi:hypothetical protein